MHSEFYHYICLIDKTTSLYRDEVWALWNDNELGITKRLDNGKPGQYGQIKEGYVSGESTRKAALQDAASHKGRMNVVVKVGASTALTSVTFILC
jgi:hypothetical protein